MGTGFTERNDKVNGVIEPVENRTGRIGSSNSKSSADTSSTSTGTAGTAGTVGTAGTGTAGTEKVADEKFSELAFLTEDEKRAYDVADDTEKKRLLRNAKRRQRYQNEKTGQAKPRKVNKKKSVEPPINNDSLKLMIVTVSGLVASRPGMEHWMLSDKEIDSIVTPLGNILKDYNAFSTLGEHSNEIALAMACITVFAPRLFVTASKMKERKKNDITGNSVNTNVTGTGKQIVRKESDRNKDIDKRDNRQSAVTSADHVHDVSWYGQPLA